MIKIQLILLLILALKDNSKESFGKVGHYIYI